MNIFIDYVDMKVGHSYIFYYFYAVHAEREVCQVIGSTA